MSETWIQVITIVASNLIIMLTFFTTTVVMWINTDKKIDAIHEEIKDFHGRLCAIEERNRGKK